MDFKKMTRGGACACGRVHTCTIRDIAVGDGVIAEVPALFSGFSRILLVADENTYQAAGARVYELISDRVFDCVLFDGTPHLVPDERAIDRVTAALADADLILGVGSGVLQDLCKYVSKVTAVPYAVVATAPSMDGYASDGAAMVLGGMQVTVPAGLPIAIVADTAVMADAPADMIAAGYGDIVGKYSALADWRLSELVTGEYLCPAVFDATLDIVNRTVAAADGIRNHEKAALAVLCDALIAVGILMSYVNSSRPASGSEHHLSHFFKITGLLAGRDYLPHGIDVAGATVLTTRLREILLTADWQKATPATYGSAYREELDRVLTSIADDCVALQEKHGRYADADTRRKTYLAKEAEIRAALAGMPSSQEIAEYLTRGGIAPDVLVSFYGEPTVQDAIRYAKELKDRYTVLWVASDLGIYGDL